MFSQIYNWLVGRMLIKCSYCGSAEYIQSSSYNPNTIYCCSNTCSYQYYNKFCNPSSYNYNSVCDDGTIKIEIV